MTICLLRLSQIDLPRRPCLLAMGLLVQNESFALFNLALPRSAYCHLFGAQVNTSLIKKGILLSWHFTEKLYSQSDLNEQPMKKSELFLLAWGKRLAWVALVIIFFMPLYFFRLERELKFFKRNAYSYKRFMEAVYTSPEGMMSKMPLQLSNIPFGEQMGIVLSSKTLDIRGDLCPYNASIFKKDAEGYHLFFRYDEIDESVRGGLSSHIGYVELDPELKQTEKEFVPIDARSKNAEDVRVVQANNKTFLVYNDLVKDRFADTRIMCLAELDLARLKIKTISKLDPRLQAIEKNWVPFEYTDSQGESSVYFEYSAVPLKVVKVTDQDDEPLLHLPSTYNRHLQGVYWPALWGIIRGGTTAQLVDGQYPTFFHSSFRDKNGVQWYCMGAYTFEAQPPFRITGISNYPILFKGIYDTPPMNTSDPLKRVIFPCGFVVENKPSGDVIHLSCGENDAAVKIVTLDKKALLKGMKKIKLKNKAP